MANNSFIEIRAYVFTLPEVTEEPHFEKTSFRVKGKIFLTHKIDSDELVVKLSLVDQDVFTKNNLNLVAPIDNKWGKQGWTQIKFKELKWVVLQDIISCAYSCVAPKGVRPN